MNREQVLAAYHKLLMDMALLEWASDSSQMMLGYVAGATDAVDVILELLEGAN